MTSDPDETKLSDVTLEVVVTAWELQDAQRRGRLTKWVPLVRVAEVEVVSVSREPLRLVAMPGELTAEGFPEWDTLPSGAPEFCARYFTPQGVDMGDDVTRIEWRYLPLGFGEDGNQ